MLSKELYRSETYYISVKDWHTADRMRTSSAGGYSNSVEDIFKRFEHVVKAVSNYTYNRYAPYVEFDDVYAEACLLLVEMCESGSIFRSANKLAHVSSGLIVGLRMFCIREAEAYYGNRKAIGYAQHAHRENVLRNKVQRMVEEAPVRATRRSLNMFEDYYFGGIPTLEISKKYNVSTSRVQQLLTKTLRDYQRNSDKEEVAILLQQFKNCAI